MKRPRCSGWSIHRGLFQMLTLPAVIVAVAFMRLNEQSSSAEMAHSMGYTVYDFDMHNVTSGDIENLKRLVSEHGVIVIKSANNAVINSHDLLSFAASFGELVDLPNGFGFNSSNASETGSSITNITNINPMSGKIEEKNTAEYLHNDGDFWQNHYIYSFLYGEVIPNIGGQTQFVDLQFAHNYLRHFHQHDIYDQVRHKRVVIDVNDIPDFRHSPFLSAFRDEYGVAKHEIVSKHAVTRKPVLYYACKFAMIDTLTPDDSYVILNAIDDILTHHDEMAYVHEWDERDLLIWDNTRVMHRSMGGYFTNARKLWRVQTRMEI